MAERMLTVRDVAAAARVSETVPVHLRAVADLFIAKLTDEELAPINCALSQVTFGLHQAGLRFDDTVVIQGAGGLGLNAIAVAEATAVSANDARTTRKIKNFRWENILTPSAKQLLTIVTGALAKMRVGLEKMAGNAVNREQ